MTRPPNPNHPAMTEAEREAMVALADACEKATGPDRELDAAVYDLTPHALDYQRIGIRLKDRSRLDRYHDGWMTVYGARGEIDPYPEDLPRYTASLDAAETLVPKDADAAGERFRLEAYNLPGVLPDHVRASAWVAGAPRVYAATPALALTAAAIRARANQGTPA